MTTKVDEEESARTVFLEPLKPRLTILSCALSGLQNEIITSEREGGWSGLKFYLPKSISFSNDIETNINFLIFRVLYLSVQQKMRLNWDGIQEYPTVFDRRHNINLVASYYWGQDRLWEASVRWNFGSGFPFTQTKGFYPEIGFVDPVTGQPSVDFD